MDLAYKVLQNAVNRKLFVQLKEFSEEKLKEYEAGEKIDSEPFVIDVNGLKSDWLVEVNVSEDFFN